jgi:AcrR family transcriptional regulator
MGSRDSVLPARPAATKAQTMLQVSRAVVDLFIEHRTSNFTVKELAVYAGISERSFYRYFPRKEDVVRPFLTAGFERVAAIAANRPISEPVDRALVAAWSDSWVATQAERHKTLFRVLDESDVFRAISFQVINESGARWAEVIAQRIGIDARSQQATLAGAVVVAAARLSAQSFTDTDPTDSPADVFASSMRLIGIELFTPRPTTATRKGR